MAAILIIWTAITFRQPLPRPLPDNLGINYNGFSSIAVMPISLFSASVFRCAFPKYNTQRSPPTEGQYSPRMSVALTENIYELCWSALERAVCRGECAFL